MLKVRKHLNFISMLFYGILFSIFLLPPVQIHESFPKIRMEDFFILIIILILFVNNKIKFNISLEKYIIFLLFFSLWICITLLLNISLVTQRSIYEIFKIWKYIGVIIIAYYFYEKNINSHKFIDIIFVIVIIFNFLSYFNIFNFFYFMKPFFYSINPYHYDYNMQRINSGLVVRLLGTMGNPNKNALMSSFFIIYYFVLFKNNKKIYTLIFLILSILILLLSNSRTIFIALVIAIIIYLILIKKNYLLAFFSILFTIILMLVLLNFSEFSYLTSIITKPISQNTSLLKRFEIWDKLISMVGLEHFLYGFGPYKEFFYNNFLMAESEYVLMYWRYGIIGLIFHFFMIFIPLLLIKKNRNTEYINILFLFSIVILISDITMAQLADPRFNTLFAILVGYGYASLNKNKTII